LARLDGVLGAAGQGLPVDPPAAGRMSVGTLLACNESGSRRYGYGTIREHLIGLTVLLADGRAVRSAGRVVKNVAGYDLQKLFVGSRGSLGVIVEATFKVLPLPEVETLVEARCASLSEAGALLETVRASTLAPVLMDLHNLNDTGATGGYRLVLGFAGYRESVEDEVARARALGVTEPTEWKEQDRFWSEQPRARRVSVLPSRTVDTIAGLGAGSVLAHAGNGVIHYRGGQEPPEPEAPWELLRRVKATFDPEGRMPAPPWGSRA
jgi:glycolate oxidase FAD binding subunit